METTFWQANFWGIVGTISGTLGLLISWLNWRYSKPKIQITKLELEIPRSSGYLSIEKNKICNYSMDYNLRIRARNKKGGSGSIEKPILIIRFSHIKKLIFIKKYKELRLNPITQHKEEKPTGTNSYSVEIIREGESWNFGPGSMVDDKLRYYLSYEEKEVFYDIIRDKQVEYFIEYHNNFGKRFTRRVSVINED